MHPAYAEKAGNTHALQGIKTMFLQNKMELLSRLELPNLLITNEVLYRLSYSSTSILSIVLYFAFSVNRY